MRIMCGDVAYNVTIVGQGAPIIFLHGFTGSYESWARISTPLSEHYTTICVDLLGHGESSKPANSQRYTMPNVADDLCHICDELHISNAHVVGYSMGGRLALYWALHKPHYVKTLILESASPGLKREAERLARQKSDNLLAARIEAEGIEAFVAYWETLPLWESQQVLPPAVRHSLRQQRLKNSSIGLATSLRGMGTGQQPSLWDSLIGFTKPVLLIAGLLDKKYTQIAQKMDALFPASELCLINGAGHNVHLEAPESVISAIDDFLSRQR